MAISYDQARADHEYLWTITPAGDMTGGYVDQYDLEKLLKTPTKATARQCYCAQIARWFQAPFDNGGTYLDHMNDPTVSEIAIRHGFENNEEPDVGDFDDW